MGFSGSARVLCDSSVLFNEEDIIFGAIQYHPWGGGSGVFGTLAVEYTGTYRRLQ